MLFVYILCILCIHVGVFSHKVIICYQVISQLVIQRSRNEFLTMALEVELRRHRELHHLLTSVYTKLQKQYTELHKRLVKYNVLMYQSFAAPIGLGYY